MNEELKPCPFCGGPVELERAHVRRDRFEGDRQFWGIVCRNTFNHGGSCCMEQVPSASPEAAIKRWNSRPDIDRIADLERQLAERQPAAQQGSLSSVEDARDAARWRYVTEIMGLRFKPSNERPVQSLEDTNATVDAEIAALQAGKEKE